MIKRNFLFLLCVLPLLCMAQIRADLHEGHSRDPDDYNYHYIYYSAESDWDKMQRELSRLNKPFLFRYTGTYSTIHMQEQIPRNFNAFRCTKTECMIYAGGPIR